MCDKIYNRMMSMNKNKRRRYLIVSVIISIALLFSVFSYRNYKLGKENAAADTLAGYSNYTNKLIVFDLDSFINTFPSSNEQYDYLKVAFAIQGLVNRQQPLLFYKYQFQGADDFWLSDLTSQGGQFSGYEIITYNSFDQVISLAKSLGVVNGAVLWDPNVPATSNVASTIAGVEGLIPIRKDVSKQSCYTDLIVNNDKFTVVKDLTGKFTNISTLPDANLNPNGSSIASTGSSKNDAYRWAKKYYLDNGKTNKSLLAYSRDAWTPPCDTGVCFVQYNVPSEMTPGEEREVSVTIYNNAHVSGEIFTYEGDYRIAAANDHGGNNSFTVVSGEFGIDQGTNAAKARVFIDPSNPISPGERFTVKFTIKAPSSQGTYYLNLGFVHDGSDWFDGELKKAITVSSTSSGNELSEPYGAYYGGLFNVGLNSSDYLIQNKAFFFDLSMDETITPVDDRNQLPGTDVTTLRAILEQESSNNNHDVFTVSGFPPWFAKYTNWCDAEGYCVDPNSSIEPVPSEWKMVEIVSEYGGEVDADGMGPVGLTNASVYTHVNLQTPFVQNNDKEAIMDGSVVKEVYDANTKYFVMYMGDYDGGSWVNALLAGRYMYDAGEPSKYPLVWPIEADISKRVPQVYNYMYKNQGRNDYIVAGDNGTGYLNPMKTPYLSTWINHNKIANNNFDIDIMGFLISGFQVIDPTVKNAYSEAFPAAVFYQGNITGESTNIPFINSFNVDPQGGETVPQNIYRVLTSSSEQFYLVRTVQHDRTSAYNNIEQVLAIAAANGQKIKIVDPYTMAYLIRNHPSQYKGCYVNGTTYQWYEGATAPSGTYVSTVSSAADCHGTATTVTKPTLAQTSFVETGSNITPTINNFDSNTMTKSGDLSGKNPGNYTITISLKDKTNYKWSDGTTSDVSLTWKITEKTKLTKPTLSATSFVENGSDISPTINGFDSTKMTKSGDLTKKDPGNYTITISLKDKTNYKWSDGSTSDVSLTWKITARTKVPKPTLAQSTFIETGSTIAPAINGFDSSTMNKSGIQSAATPGTYAIIISIKDPTHYTWSDGSTEPVTLPWTITAKTKVNKPSLAQTTYMETGSPISPAINGFNSSIMTKTGNLSASAVGSYSITVSLKDTTHYAWSDGSTGPITLKWNIQARTKLTKPKLVQTAYMETGSPISPTVNGFDTATMSRSGTYSAINPGNYTVTFSIKNPANYTWSDGSTGPVSLSWTIKPKTRVNKPSLSTTSIMETGSTVGPDINGFDSTIMTRSGGVTGVNPGTYKITISLKDKANFAWNDGTTSDLILTWRITERPRVQKPTLAIDSYVANGDYIIPTINNFNDSLMTKSGDTQAKNPGTYTITINLKNPSQFAWSDGSTGPVTLIWHIVQGQAVNVPKPTLAKSSFVETGSNITPTIKGFDGNIMTKSGGVSGTNPGTYKITISLKNTNNYHWSDGSKTPVTLTWEITSKVRLQKPYFATPIYVETGSDITPTISGFFDESMSKSGTLTAKDPGTYTVTINLKDTANNAWDDGSTGPVTISWQIVERQKLNKPTLATASFDETGEDITPTINGFDSEKMEKTGDLTKKEPGTYTITVSLKHTDAYTWSDGSTSDVTLTWDIKEVIEEVLGTLEYTITNNSDNKPVANVLVEVHREDNDEVIYSGKSNSEGKVIVQGLPEGDYYVVEKEAPEGYEVNGVKKSFAIKENGEIVKLSANNKPTVNPKTAGISLGVLTFYGVILAIIGIVLFVVRNKKRIHRIG